MTDIFVSYKSEDRASAARVASAFERLGFVVWWDLELIAGDVFREAIRAVIDQSKAVVVLWSPRSVTSSWVLDEATYALKLNKLCPALIESAEIPLGFGQTQASDILDWKGESSHRGFQALLRGVEAKVGRKGVVGSDTFAAQSASATLELRQFKEAQARGSRDALRRFLEDHPNSALSPFVSKQISGANSFTRGLSGNKRARPRAQASDRHWDWISPAFSNSPLSDPKALPGRLVVALSISLLLVALGATAWWRLDGRFHATVHDRIEREGEAAAFGLASDADSEGAYRAYLQRYPTGQYASVATAARDRLASAREASEPIEVRVCNRSGERAQLAVLYRPPNDRRWRTSGWYTINDRDCIAAFSTNNRIFFLYAESSIDSGRWGGDHRSCILADGAFDFSLFENQPCPQPRRTVGFRRLELSPGVRDYTWTLGD